MEDLDRKITIVSGTVEKMSNVVLDGAQGMLPAGYISVALTDSCSSTSLQERDGMAESSRSIRNTRSCRTTP